MEHSDANQLSTPRPPYLSANANYQSTVLSRRNYVKSITDEETCSVWVTYLPPYCDYAMLAHALKETGKIYSMLIHPPRDNDPSSAAKIVFWDRQGVDRLIQLFVSGEFMVGRSRPNVTYCRRKVSDQIPSVQTRVLEIRGPMQIVNPEFLYDFFIQRFQFDVENIKIMKVRNGIVTMRWTFSSYRCQSQFAFIHIHSQKRREYLANLERPI
ncbi:hypothetical protein F4811DRAFT_529754 [Daldinia bambusicola]|nr:hypothetical protein F4811DRAFT_529754 [Daldinia bambusicola]